MMTKQKNIVGSKEADPSNNKISNESPIAKAIMNAKVGEVKKVASPNGEYEVEIVEICQGGKKYEKTNKL